MSLLEVGEMQRYYLKNGKARYQIELAHRGLKRHKLIKGDDQRVVGRKAQLQLDEWEERWAKQEAKRQAAERKQRKEDQAEERTQEAQELLERLQATLAHTLAVDDAISWEDLLDRQPFPKPRPERKPDPPPPSKEMGKYQLKLGILDKLFSSRRERKIDEAARALEGDVAEWERESEERAEAFRVALADWELAAKAYSDAQEEANAVVIEHRDRYLAGDAEAVTEYCDLVLSRSEYPECLPQEFELFYNPTNRMMVVDYQLPAPEDLPTLKEVRYVKSRDEFSEKELSDRDSKKLYDSVVYQICLRTIHELYEADAIGALDSIVFNGRVETIDKATGNQVSACIISLQAGREEFDAINLEHVEPKQCFKALKGVGSSKLHVVTPIAPIIQVDREDARFIDSYEVAARMDESTNLAAISWEDFEHLVRELFEQEFASGGGEVRVTHASRDGGVDAVAFDPDPIRGGKIVIQAKRYTNTVGVTAVRDLFGTVMNEGATKGILVTTSDFGPDAYSFANGKPITLLSGANLLHLLERHGHKAKIDLQEAKRLAAEAD